MLPTAISLRSRVFNAGIWVIGGTGVGQVLRLANNLILTRLLVPDMFGMMAVVTSILVGMALFSDLGFQLYIIQSKRGDDPDFLNSIWSIGIVRGFILWLLALMLCFGLFTAGELGWLKENTTYAEPILPYVLAVASLNLLIMGFQSTKEATATRQLAQKALFLIELYSQVVGLAVMIVWALIDKSIWALVFGSIVTTLVKVILTHSMLPGVSNRWHWDWPIFWKALGFGQWILLSSALSFLFQNGDRLLLGGMVSAQALGVYSIAFLMVNAIQGAFSKIYGKVAFPAMSEVYRDNPSGLKTIYYRFRYRLDPILLLSAALLLIFGGNIIDILYDSRYAESGPMLQLLSLILVAQIYELSGRCFLTLGKPKLLSLLNAIRAAALFALVPIGYSLGGMMGAIFGIVASYFSAVPVAMAIKARYGLLDARWELIMLGTWAGIFCAVYALVPGFSLTW